MQGDIKDFKTGWFGLMFGLRPSEIEDLIKKLQHLQSDPDNYHFHFRNDFEETGGIADVEIYAFDEDSKGNLKIE